MINTKLLKNIVPNLTKVIKIKYLYKNIKNNNLL